MNSEKCALLAVAGLLLLLLLRTVRCILLRCRSKGRQSPVRTLAVLGSGGHTAEMCMLLQSLEPARYTPLMLVTADTDSSSATKARASLLTPSGWSAGEVDFYSIPRSREVGQGWASTVLSTLRATAAAFSLVLRLGPELLIVNGPGTCVPVCVATLVLLRILGLRCSAGGEPRIIFVESFCRVHTLSMTGKLLYHLRIADRVVVHWEGLAAQFPRVEFLGQLL